MTTRRVLVRSTILGALGASAFPVWAHPPLKEIKAIDTHAHIFSRGLALAPVHRYAPDYDATVDHLVALSKRHGITHGVLIQPSFLGMDNSYLVAALRTHRKRFRGIAVIDPDRDYARLDELDDVGCVGIRLNLFGFPDPNLDGAAMRRVIAKLRDLNWLIEIHVEAHRLRGIMEPLLDSGVPIVVDHFGRPSPQAGVRDLGFRYLLSTAKSRRVWIKISGAYRNGDQGIGERIALEAMPLLKQSFGLERILWGSDWPHTQFEQQVTYESAFQFLCRMLPDAGERQMVLAGTPAELFKFRQGTVV